jgi:hypothetical protein
MVWRACRWTSKFHLPAQSPHLNTIEQFWSVLETRETDSHLQHLESNLKMFFKKNGIQFRQSLLKIVRVHCKGCGCTGGKRWSNTILIKKCVQYLLCFHYFVQPCMKTKFLTL